MKHDITNCLDDYRRAGIAHYSVSCRTGYVGLSHNRYPMSGQPCSDLAVRVVDAICKMVEDQHPGETVQRFALKGGVYPHSEVDIGGYSKAALTRKLDEALREEIFIRGPKA